MTCSRGCCPTQGEHYRSLVIAGAPSAKTMEQRRDDADMDAYKRLRKDGLQPRGIEGSAALEKAAFTRNEIETGTLIRNERLAKQAQKAADIMATHDAVTPIGGAA